MRYGDRGSEVKAVQRALMQRGYELPQYGADGDLGGETWDALQRFAGDLQLGWAPAIPDQVIETLLAPPADQSLVVDLTSRQSNPPEVQGKHRISGGKVVERSPEIVQGIIVHQTAVWFGVSERQRRLAGSVEDGLHHRALNVGAHMTAFDGRGANVHCGHVCYTNPLSWYVYHANGANRVSVGIEIEGDYPGLVGNSAPLASEALIAAARQGLAFMVTEGRRLGMPMRYVWAHRQSSPTRRNDPGEELWRRVVLEYAVPVLGLETQPRRVWGQGRPIPRQWDPDGEGDY
ncbi:peptidoglycan recognition protein family protein [Haliangium sp.]|uniref:peptidoglycan recognition protein family protein n=1 Tax=Haliangium sp. TaxID=2663208 RepID=UPI003D13FFAB